MFRADQERASAFGLATDDRILGVYNPPPTLGTTGASYSPEVGNPNGYFYPTIYRNTTNQDVNVIAQGVAPPMPAQPNRVYDASWSLGVGDKSSAT